MGKSFLITGYGRSGTKLLSSLMNKSNSWQVEHEPRGVKDEISGKKNDPLHLNVVQKSFTDNYGEVNSYLRYYFEQVDVDKNGLLLRNPKKIFLSVANRKPQKLWSFHINEIHFFYEKFLSWVENGIYPAIFFEKLVSDVDYANKIIKDYGVLDLEILESDLSKKVNQNKKVLYKDFSDLPTITQRNIKKYFDPQIERYNKIKEK